AVIPVLFVVSVEAARHAVGRIADITADKHMEGVRLTRWLLSPVPTFKLWRRMKLWELRSYEQVIKLEQDRLIYQARLQARFGRNWRRKAPVESLMPLRLAKYGVPLAETAPAGLVAAGIEPALLPPALTEAQVEPGELQPELSSAPDPQHEQREARVLTPAAGTQTQEVPASPEALQFTEPGTANSSPEKTHGPGPRDARADERLVDSYRAWAATFASEPTSWQVALWLQDQHGITTAAGDPLSDDQLQPLLQVLKQHGAPEPADVAGPGTPQEETWGDYFYNAWLTCASERGLYPDAAVLAEYVYQRDGIRGATGQPVTADELRPYVAMFQEWQGDGSEPVPPAREEPDAETREQQESEPPQGQQDGAPTGIGSPSASATTTSAGARGAAAADASAGNGSSAASVPGLATMSAPGGGERLQPSAHDTPRGRASEELGGEPAMWEASVTDTGAATARVPEQQIDEPATDPVQQQIVTVSQWLAEAEDAGQKLSGAEVARRLGVSPKTGQRRVTAAAQYLEEQRRLQGRAHLRSVSS
ncbi:DUF2637 domain-containing protein, partial [Streptomyces sp. NPDC053720]|uniref:DUF2637 domain-containing protein n=1 Tax=Streptomyces sp. NPDC053720 TaxID=3154855 RepID=UPI00343C24C2